MPGSRSSSACSCSPRCPPGPARRSARARRGTAFYTPPKSLVKGAHGSLIWARKLTGNAALKGGSGNRLLLYRSTGVDRRAHRGVGDAGGPEGTTRRRAAGRSSRGPTGRPGIADRCAPSRAGRAPAPAPARALAEGGLRDRAHRLRGPRHAGRPPVPDRTLRGPLGARRRARRAQARQAALQAASSSPATRRAARPRCGRPRWRRGTRPNSSSAAPWPSRRPRTSRSRPRCCRTSRSPARSAAWSR